MLVNYTINALKQLEAEAIFIIRETVAQFERPVMLFSGGKDSIVMLQLAYKAFYPANIPFPLLHIDTGHNFKETLDFRDYIINKYNVELIIGSVEDSIKSQKIKEDNNSRNALQTVTLLDTIESYQFDAAFGGGRRDEEKARSKERIFSHRDEFGQWDPKNQRPEVWYLYNGTKSERDHFRIFPLSNWTEIDIWNYIKEDNIEIPPLYYSHLRKVFKRGDSLLALSPFIELTKNEYVEVKKIRFRTIGDMTCTGAIESEAQTLDDIILEVVQAQSTERGTRVDDKKTDSSMEDRKKEGYF